MYSSKKFSSMCLEEKRAFGHAIAHPYCNTSNRHFIVCNIFVRIKLQTFDSFPEKFNEVGIFAMGNSTSISFDDSSFNLSRCFCSISERKFLFSKIE